MSHLSSVPTRPLLSRRQLLFGAVAGVGLTGVLAGCGGTTSTDTDGQGPTVDGSGGIEATVTAQSGSSATYLSQPGLHPPRILVDTSRAGRDPGVIVTDCHAGESQQGPMIIGDDGDLLWFRALSDNGEPSLRAFNVRVQRYRGRPVLSWFEGAVVDGHGQGHYVIADTSYRQIATVEAANGLQGDLHEFVITEQGSALFTTYGTAYADLTSLGGPSHGAYFYCEAQEVDIASGQLLFSWRSDDHVALSSSYTRPSTTQTTPWDYFHMNSINVDPSDGNLVISSRDLWCFFKVHRPSGEVLWRLGGKQSDFAMGPDTHFAYQHDVTPQGGGLFTLFDNEGTPAVDPPSRGLVLDVDESARTAAFVRQFHHSPAVFSGALGSVQDIAAGHTFMGWGETPYMTEYGTDGTVLFDARLAGTGVESYRAFKEVWSAQPAAPPAIATERSGAGLLAYVSWNGATDVARWRLSGGPSAGALSTIGSVARVGFETRLAVADRPAVVVAEALDAAGEVIGTSAAHTT